MNAANVSLLNAVILIALGLWGYLAPEDPSPTALIPVGFGVVLLALNAGVRAHNKVVAHIAVGATLLILLGLFMPLKGAIERQDTMAMIRVAAMVISTVAAMIFFVKSFIDARKAKEQTAG